MMTLTAPYVLPRQLLQQEGVEEDKITLVTLVTCPEAADKFCEVRARHSMATHSSRQY